MGALKFKIENLYSTSNPPLKKKKNKRKKERNDCLASISQGNNCLASG